MRQATGLERAMTHAVQHVQELPAELTARPSLPLALVTDILSEKHHLHSEKDWKISANRSTSPSAAKCSNACGSWTPSSQQRPCWVCWAPSWASSIPSRHWPVSGVSDPGQVSQGIGTALYATALGIGIAVIGMLFFNLFQERIERINDHLKVLMLRACVGRGGQPQSSPQPHNKLHVA
jgi:biopolymer transport protein ExbB